MLAHQKNDSGNSLIHDYMLRYYGEPKDFASFLYASQVLQAEAVKVGAEGWRRDRPRTMGSIFWQLNDCWPVASWSSIDYYGRWKALQYYARRFYAPVLVSPHVEDGVIAVYIVSDHTAPEQAQLRLRIMHFDGSMIREMQQSVTVRPLSSQRALAVPLSELQETGKPSLDPSQIFVAAELSIAGHIVSSNILYLAPSKQVHLPEASITTNLTKVNDGFDLTLHSPALARDVYVSFTDADATFSDNYVDLLPGETKSIHVSSSAGLNVLQAQLSVRSLAGTFIKELAKRQMP
jgi:beta-mannosidase